MEKQKYRFVKIRRAGSNMDGIWYFKPSSEGQLLEHFNKVFGAEIRNGVRDHIKGTHLISDKSKPDGYWVYHSHPATPWARAVGVYWELFGGTWVEAATRLENETLNNRVNDFRNGKESYFDNGVVETIMCKGDEIVEECIKDELVYPEETHCRLEDVRYMRWDMPDLKIKGTHWYAKLGRFDVKDKDGNMKWDTKEEAEKAAEWFVDQQQYKRYNE